MVDLIKGPLASEVGDAMPVPETDELGRYLEDTITIDWQTPVLAAKARELLDSRPEPQDRVRALFEFVRDRIDHSFDVETEAQTCRASEVLSEGTGLCYAKSHLLAGLLRYAGFPTGFCYMRLVDDERTGRFVLHGFNAIYWAPTASWIYCDARGNRGDVAAECRFESPFSLALRPDATRGESYLPFIYKRPAKKIVDLLERAPSLDAIRRNLPDSI